MTHNLLWKGHGCQITPEAVKYMEGPLAWSDTPATIRYDGLSLRYHHRKGWTTFDGNYMSDEQLELFYKAIDNRNVDNILPPPSMAEPPMPGGSMEPITIPARNKPIEDGEYELVVLRGLAQLIKHGSEVAQACPMKFSCDAPATLLRELSFFVQQMQREEWPGVVWWSNGQPVVECRLKDLQEVINDETDTH